MGYNTGTRCKVLFGDARSLSPAATHHALPPLPLADASTYDGGVIVGPRRRGERTSAWNVGGDRTARGVGGGTHVEWCAVVVQDVAPYGGARGAAHGDAQPARTYPCVASRQEHRHPASRDEQLNHWCMGWCCVRPPPPLQWWAPAPKADGADGGTAALLCSRAKPCGDITIP